MEDKIIKIIIRKEVIHSTEVQVNLYTTRPHHISEDSFGISHLIVRQISHIMKLNYKYRCSPVTTGYMFQDTPQLRETADNIERYI
jgi:hypothetical protein